MKNKLDIRKSISNKYTLLELDGRLDANWAGHLDDYINSLVRDGSYDLSLDLSNVQYISSAGIRILVGQYKKLHKIGGSFYLSALSKGVRDILEMVGMVETLTQKPKTEDSEQEPVSGTIEKFGYRFENSKLADGDSMKVTVTGDPKLVRTSAFEKKHNQKISFGENKFGLGLGALGSGFDDCKNRYGEFIALGDALAYMPTDGSKVPDYSMKSGRLIPEINALYALLAEGSFSNIMAFNPAEGNRSIVLSNLIELIMETSGRDHVVLLMIAESDGLVGLGLNKSPLNGESPFEFPAVKEFVNFTTEPAYSKMITVSFGYLAKNAVAPFSDFLRPVKPGSEISGHIHTAVFPYQPLKKATTDFRQGINSLFLNSEVQDILHLTNDSREINGLGESRFKQGYCWIGK